MANKNVVLTQKNGLSTIATILIMAAVCVIGVGAGYWLHSDAKSDTAATMEKMKVLTGQVGELQKDLESTKKIIAERDAQINAATQEKIMLLAQIDDLQKKLGEKPVEAPVVASKPSTGAVEKVSAVVFFDFDSSVVRDEFKAELMKVAQLIKSKKAALVIEGHTDSIGDKDYNMWLSKQRADAVLKVILEMSGDSKPCNMIIQGSGFMKTANKDIPNKEKRKVLITAVEDCKGVL